MVIMIMLKKCGLVRADHHRRHSSPWLILIYVTINTLLDSYRTVCAAGDHSAISSSTASTPPQHLIDALQFNNNPKLSQNIATESVQLSTRTIQTKYGSIRGSLVKLSSMNSNQHRPYSPNGVKSMQLSDVETYLGVPYATPPTGGLRFMPPVTPTHWRGVRLVNRLRPVCPQHIPIRDYHAIRSRNETDALQWMPRSRYEYLRRLIPMLGNQSEDCLYLNIYVPVSNGRSEWNSNVESGDGVGYPVIVMLNGESYDWHSGNVFDGSILASYGQVIVVTVNFRLGILGFLPAFADGTIRGNYGLMDQVAALHWIQENIGEFGGQTNNVTLIGHGHGAACAHLLMLSPMAKGLFNRVILMSGSALSPWAIARNPEHYARILGQKLNCTDLETMIDCLRAKKISQLIAQYEKTNEQEQQNQEHQPPEHLTTFGPIIDSIVVPYDPMDVYHRSLYHSESPSSSSFSTWQMGAMTNQSSSSSSSSGVTNSDPLSLARSYDLMVGVTDVDIHPCLFSEHESIYGVEPDRRDRILRTLVRNQYDFHQQAIFLILYNEYSSWWPISDGIDQTEAKLHRSSFDILDSSKSMLQDGLVFAPLVRTADFHSDPWSDRPMQTTSSKRMMKKSSNRAQNSRVHYFNQQQPGKVFFYRFETNQVSQESLYEQMGNVHYSSSNEMLTPSGVQHLPGQHLSPSKRMICSIGHDLAYLFGDPLARLQLGLNSQVGPFYYPVNLTRTHQIVSELFMQYVVNFARFGEPNQRSPQFVPPMRITGPRSNLMPAQQSAITTKYWPRYNVEQKNYLLLGTVSPKPLDHRHNHRLSLWLNLIPRLLIDDQEFFQTNLGANLTKNQSNKIMNNQQRNAEKYYNNWSSKRWLQRQTTSSSPSSGNSGGGQLETLKHIADDIDEPHSSSQLNRQHHHLLVDYNNLKSYDGIVRNMINNNHIQTSSNQSNLVPRTNESTLNQTNNQTLNNHTNSFQNSTMANSTFEASAKDLRVYPSSGPQNIDHQTIFYTGNSPPGQNNQENPTTATASTWWWLIMIGSACSILFFINVIFFIALFYQLKKNRKFQQNFNGDSPNIKNSDQIQSIESTMLMVDHPAPTSPFRGNKNHKTAYADIPPPSILTGNNGALMDSSLAPPLQSASDDLNLMLQKKHIDRNQLYHPQPIGPSIDSLNFELTNTSGATNNYVPFLTNTTSTNNNKSHHAISQGSAAATTTTYYCLQVSTNDNAQQQAQQTTTASTNTGYREMSV